MYRVTRLDPVSWAKAYTLATLAIAVGIGLLVLIPLILLGAFGLLTAADNEATAAAGAAGGIGILVGVAALAAFALMVFLVALLQGAAFNWALARTGGLRISLGLDAAPSPPAPAPTGQGGAGTAPEAMD